MLDKGGVDFYESVAAEKCGKVYDAIARRPDLYSCPVDLSCRSRINVVFRILGGGDGNGSEREREFLKRAEELGMRQLKGHRSVGGIRASLYNALDIASVDALVQLMDEFVW